MRGIMLRTFRPSWASRATIVLLSIVFSATVATVPTAYASNAPIGAPVVVFSPLSAHVSVGDVVTLRAAAKGSPTPTAQWYRSGKDGWIRIVGATKWTYRVRATSALNGTLFHAIFFNHSGSHTTSNAQLFVSSTPTTPTSPPRPPTITVEPAALTAGVVGHSATFSAAATGSPAPTVVWRQQLSGS
jgi:hypothetical protein